MTQTLTGQFSEAQNPTTQARVQMSVVKTAQDVSSEDPSTPGHALRVNLATRVAQGSLGLAPSFTAMVCAQGITSQSDDAEINTMVSAVWNTMAGVVSEPA